MAIMEVVLTQFEAVTIGLRRLVTGNGVPAQAPMFKELRGISCRVVAI